jgi:hypothetical protein
MLEALKVWHNGENEEQLCFKLSTMIKNHAICRNHLIGVAFVFGLLAGCSEPGASFKVDATGDASAPDEESVVFNSPTPLLSETPAFTSAPSATPTQAPTLTPKPPPFFDTFVASLMNDNPDQVVGVFVEDVMALKVVQQPASDPGFVSTLPETATYFTMAMQYTGNVGLLAHNYLAGIYYFDLLPGQIVVLIYGDGQTEEYIVSEEQEYQALSPYSPTSSFIDLATGEQLTSNDLFYRVYGGADRTTLQTCIAQGSIDSWGRLFVISLQE